MQVLFLFGSVGLLVSCGEKEKPKELVEAFKLHEEAIKIRQQVGEKVDRLVANTDSLFVAVNKNSIDSIQTLLEAWDEQLVEVPGFEEEHDHEGHDHDHDHDHGEELKLTPKQHLEVQTHLLNEIKALSSGVEQIKE